MRLKIKNIWKIFLSTAISTSMAATKAFAVVTIREGDVDTEMLINEHRVTNPGHPTINVLLKPFVNGKTVYNDYNRADDKFDFICLKRATDAKNIGTTMTRAHCTIRSISLLNCKYGQRSNKPNLNAESFGYPICEQDIIATLVKALDDNIIAMKSRSTTGNTEKKGHYDDLLKLIRLTATHIWFLRCPEGYGECRKIWTTFYKVISSPFFHKIGSEFVDNDGKVRIGPEIRRSTIPGTVFGSIGHPALKDCAIKALTIVECAWESKAFENGKNSLDTSPDTQRIYDILNETFYALVMYGLGEIGAANGEQLAKYYNSFSPIEEQVDAKTATIQNIYDALATSLGNAITAVNDRYQIGDGVLNIIKRRCKFEEKSVDGRVTNWEQIPFKKLVKSKGSLLVWPKVVPPPQSPAVPANLTPPPAKRPRVGASPALNQGQQQQYLPVITGLNTYVSPIQQNEIYAQDNATDPFSGLPCNPSQPPLGLDNSTDDDYSSPSSPAFFSPNTDN